MAKRISLYSLLLAVALIFSYVEALFPLDFIFPGVKIGLANCIVLLLLKTEHKTAAFFINLCRVFICALLFGSATSLIYSLCGAVVSYIIMVLAQKIKCFGVFGISILGGISHNLAQTLVARAVLGTNAVFYYLPILVLLGALAGALCGIIGGAVFKNKNIQNLFLA